jgi:hypothetical protein
LVDLLGENLLDPERLDGSHVLQSD